MKKLLERLHEWLHRLEGVHDVSLKDALRFQRVVEGSRDAMLLMREDFQLLLVNPACRALLGLKPGQTHSAYLKINLRFEPDIDLAGLTDLCLSGEIAEHRCIRRDGTELHIELSAAWVDGADVGMMGAEGMRLFSVTLHDVTERKKMEQALRISEERLRFETLHDQLTGLANRSLCYARLAKANAQKIDHPEHRFAVLFLDLDHFKLVNDTFGHLAGDELLIEVTRRLKNGLKSIDSLLCQPDGITIARLSGDEFVILLDGLLSAEAVHWPASILVNALNLPYITAGREVRLSVSIGCVIPELAYANAEDIVRDADFAMYQAKRMGGGRVCYFSGPPRVQSNSQPAWSLAFPDPARRMLQAQCY